MGRTLREGPKPLEEHARFFHRGGYSVYLPYDPEVQTSSVEIKARDMEALKKSDIVVLELQDPSLGVAQELGAARALEKPVVLITSSQKALGHNWVKGDRGIRCCATQEEALEFLKGF